MQALVALLVAAVVGIQLGILFGMLPTALGGCSALPERLEQHADLLGTGVHRRVRHHPDRQGPRSAPHPQLFIFMMNARLGVVGANPHRNVCRTLGASRSQLFRKLYVPVAVPGILAAFRLGMVYALLGVEVDSEMGTSTSRAGVGQLITNYSATLSMAHVYRPLIVLALFAAVLTMLIGALESLLLRWRHVGAHG